MTYTLLFTNQLIICIVLLLAAGMVLLLIKYFALKKTVRETVQELKATHTEEIKQFMNQFYFQLNQDFKVPVTTILQKIEKLATDEEDPDKKKELTDTLQKIKIVQHKLNLWPQKGKVKEDPNILDRLKKEIYLHAEELYPHDDVSSVKTVLEDTHEDTNTEPVKEYLEKGFSPEIFSKQLNSADEKLLKNILEYVQENLENPDLSIEAMSKEMGLSRNHLHRKLKAMTGQSPVEFLKTIRMSYAAHLLSTGKWSVSEVGYKVGYNTPSYFSTSFTAHFGMPPTTYIEKKRIN